MMESGSMGTSTAAPVGGFIQVNNAAEMTAVISLLSEMRSQPSSLVLSGGPTSNDAHPAPSPFDASADDREKIEEIHQILSKPLSENQRRLLKALAKHNEPVEIIQLMKQTYGMSKGQTSSAVAKFSSRFKNMAVKLGMEIGRHDVSPVHLLISITYEQGTNISRHCLTPHGREAVKMLNLD